MGREKGVVGKKRRKYPWERWKGEERSKHSKSQESEQLRMAEAWLLKIDEAGICTANCDGFCRACQRILSFRNEGDRETGTLGVFKQRRGNPDFTFCESQWLQGGE